MATALAPIGDHSGADLPLIPEALLQELARALRSIRFGNIELVIHDGRLVQLEYREKVLVQIDLTQQLPESAREVKAELSTLNGRPDHRKPQTSST